MTSRTPLTMLPRLWPARTRATAPCNLAAVLVMALAGAGVVHLLAYHLPPGVPLGPRWASTALSLLMHCPLVGPLGCILILAVALALVGLRELRRLEQLNGTLTRVLTGRSMGHGRSLPAAPPPSRTETLPRSPWRLVVFVAVLLAVQISALSLFDALYPMRMATVMVMNGAPMTMTIGMTPLLPLGVLHVVVALLLGTTLWCMERRLTHLRMEITRRLHFLRAGHCDDTCPLPVLAARLPRIWGNLTLFARPPPVVVA